MTIEKIARQHLVLKDRLNEVRMRYENLSLSVGEAKTRIEIEPEVMAVMEELQRREHERAVGAYEDLLTLFMRDVLPGHREVELDLLTERGLPALHVYMKKGENLPREDAFTGSGGSVTNILSAGLRFISLVRSGKRPFLVLDEPDCWIKPDLAPKFASVVQSVAEQLGVQVLMVSHHDEQMFETLLPHRLRLEKNGAQLTARWAPTSSHPEWSDEQEGLRSIELVNFQSHAHTVIPLSPGLTLINGDNDIGKSAIVSALRCVFDADSNDSHIRHGAKSTKVYLDFGPEKILTWERFSKGKHTVVYELREAGKSLDEEPIKKSIGARDVPEWVETFGIGLIDGIDVQLVNQKEPVFLLNKPAKERAKALAIGGENAHVQEILSIGKQEINEARLTVRNGEKELEKLHRARQTLEVIDTRDSAISALETTAAAIKEKQERLGEAEHLLARWKSAKAKKAALGPMQGSICEVPSRPEDLSHVARMAQGWRKSKDRLNALSVLHDTQLTQSVPEVSPSSAEILLARWKRAGKTSFALSGLLGNNLPELPVMSSFESAVALSFKWKKAKAELAALEQVSKYPFPTLPSIDAQSLDRISNTLVRWQSAKQAEQAEVAQLADIDAKQEQITQEISALGAKCPECGQLLPDHDHSLRP